MTLTKRTSRLLSTSTLLTIGGNNNIIGAIQCSSYSQPQLQQEQEDKKTKVKRKSDLTEGPAKKRQQQQEEISASGLLLQSTRHQCFSFESPTCTEPSTYFQDVYLMRCHHPTHLASSLEICIRQPSFPHPQHVYRRLNRTMTDTLLMISTLHKPFMISSSLLRIINKNSIWKLTYAVSHLRWAAFSILLIKPGRMPEGMGNIFGEEYLDLFAEDIQEMMGSDFVKTNNLALESGTHLILSLASILLLQNNNRLHQVMVPFFGNKLYNKIRKRNLEDWGMTRKFPGDVLLDAINIAESLSHRLHSFFFLSFIHSL
ncbi:uncharacterized protein BX664DRAFT_318287 [Halteromyces radiatus]|uniref:uncharacterized protein n=1 Tax=Halteromyces radiatus TaxID=101107 RepID=UPI00221E70F3|nr:uncharacterized protein BX664DRAFT_318287 [Halteromyces radiatus]KAI8077703.1 hypothetical protein BX664DRAFT_318287 [Halteromyces radiatus]